ncbi:glycosyltransferase, partial [Acinetobacter baumannii]
TDEQISIIVVHKDKPEFLNICLQSIAVMSFNNNIEIIVVDNGSGRESQDYLDAINDDIKVIRLESNKGWSVAANKGAAAASKTSKYLIF